MSLPHYFSLLFIVAVFLNGCAAKQPITFQSLQPGSTLSLVSLENPLSSSRTLPNPISLDVSRLNGNAVKISAPGKISQFWFLPFSSGRFAEITVKHLAGCAENQGAASRNRPTRLLIKAYQALFAKDYAVASDLAQKTAELEPDLAAPHIILGLVHHYQGDKDKARVSFNRAAALDPEDSEINQLIRMTQ